MVSLRLYFPNRMDETNMYLQALRVYNSMTLFLDSERPLFPTMNSIIFSLTLNRDDLPGWQLNLALENAG